MCHTRTFLLSVSPLRALTVPNGIGRLHRRSSTVWHCTRLSGRNNSSALASSHSTALEEVPRTSTFAKGKIRLRWRARGDPLGDCSRFPCTNQLIRTDRCTREIWLACARALGRQTWNQKFKAINRNLVYMAALERKEGGGAQATRLLNPTFYHLSLVRRVSRKRRINKRIKLLAWVWRGGVQVPPPAR